MFQSPLHRRVLGNPTISPPKFKVVDVSVSSSSESTRQRQVPCAWSRQLVGFQSPLHRRVLGNQNRPASLMSSNEPVSVSSSSESTRQRLRVLKSSILIS